MKLTKLLAIASLLTTAIAANSSSYATFVYPTSYSSAFIWSINAVESTGDVYFHFQSPTFGGSWVAVGLGASMDNSFMVVIYPSNDGSNITVPPRISTGHVEPSFTEDRTIELISDKSLSTTNGIVNGTMYANGVCRKCVTWNGGSIDLKAKNAPFIFAAGAGYLSDDSLQAPLQRHETYGHFTMDMTAAASSSNGAVPNPSNGTYDETNASYGSTDVDYHYKGTAHAGLMILSWIVLFPLGSLVLRAFNKVKLHAIVQCIGFFLVLISFGLGIYVSRLYNRSNSFKSAHQIIGIILIIGLFAQLGLGIVGHTIFKRTNQPSKLAKIHVILGMVLIAVAIVNGALGLRLAQDGQYWLRYILLVIAVFIIFTAIRILAHRCMRRRQRKPRDQQQPPPPYPPYPSQGPPQNGFANQAAPPQGFGEQGSINHGVGPDGYQVPSYSAATSKQAQVQSVPLTTYNSNVEHESNFAGPAQQPRQMV